MIKLKSMNCSSHFTGLKEIQMESFIRIVHNYKAVIADGKNYKIWRIALFCIMFVIVLLILCTTELQ